MRLKTVSALALALLLGLAQPVGAAEGGGNLFIGGGLGSADGDDTFSDGGAAFVVDDDDTFYRLVLGVDVNPWLSVHGGWIDFGEFDSTALSAAGVSSGRAEADGFYGGVTLRRSIGASHKYFIQAAIGVMAWDTEFVSGRLRAEDDGAEPYYGFGFGGKINDYWTWSADFTRYELDQIDIDAIGISVLWYPKFANP